MNTLLLIFDKDSMSSAVQESIVDYLKRSGSWARLLPNVWLIKTSSNSIQFRDELRAYSQGGNLVIFNVTKSGWATSFSNEVSTWMKENI